VRERCGVPGREKRGSYPKGEKEGRKIEEKPTFVVLSPPGFLSKAADTPLPGVGVSERKAPFGKRAQDSLFLGFPRGANIASSGVPPFLPTSNGNSEVFLHFRKSFPCKISLGKRGKGKKGISLPGAFRKFFEEKKKYQKVFMNILTYQHIRLYSNSYNLSWRWL
jgi:hypothetical protein